MRINRNWEWVVNFRVIFWGALGDLTVSPFWSQLCVFPALTALESPGLLSDGTRGLGSAHRGLCLRCPPAWPVCSSVAPSGEAETLPHCFPGRCLSWGPRAALETRIGFRVVVGLLGFLFTAPTPFIQSSASPPRRGHTAAHLSRVTCPVFSEASQAPCPAHADCPAAPSDLPRPPPLPSPPLPHEGAAPGPCLPRQRPALGRVRSHSHATRAGQGVWPAQPRVRAPRPASPSLCPFF